MAQDTVVEEYIESGKRLIEALNGGGLGTRVAFWAKPTDDEKWYLYLASPMVDAQGSGVVYRLVHGILRNLSDLWIEPLDVKVIGETDSLAELALEVIKPKVPNSPFAALTPKPYPGMTWFHGPALAGLGIDRACIYPPLQPIVPV